MGVNSTAALPFQVKKLSFIYDKSDLGNYFFFMNSFSINCHHISAKQLIDLSNISTPIKLKNHMASLRAYYGKKVKKEF